MRKFLKVASLSLAVVMLLVGTVFGAGVKEMIEVYTNTVGVSVNGQYVKSDNFLYKDTTYVPLREISEMLGKDVDWIQATQTATINDRPETDLEKLAREKAEKELRDKIEKEVRKELDEKKVDSIVPVIVMTATQGELVELKMLGTPHELYELNISRPRRPNLLKDWDWNWNWNAHIAKANRYGEVSWAINPNADLGTYYIEILGDTKVNLQLTIVEKPTISIPLVPLTPAK